MDSKHRYWYAKKHKWNAQKPYYTWEKIGQLAKSVESRTEFAQKYPGAIAKLYTSGRLEEFLGHLKRPEPVRKWTEKTIAPIAKKYKSRKQFKLAQPGAESAARKLGIMDKVCSHMSRMGSRYFRYVYEVFDFPHVYVGLSINPEARFKNHLKKSPKPVRQLFANPNKTVIISKLLTHDDAAALERRLIAKYRKHSDWEVLNSHSGGGLGSLYRVWTTKDAAKVMRGKKLKDVLENHYGAYQYAKTSEDRKYLFSLIKWERKRGKNGEKIAWSFEELKQLAKGISQAELKRKNKSAFWAFSRHPRIEEIKKVMVMAANGSKLYWTDERIEKAVRGKRPSEVPAGALDRIGNHPKKEYFRSLMKRTMTRWTFEKICEVSKGMSPSEFELKHPGGYHAACYHPRKKEIFAGMNVKHPGKVTPPLKKRVRSKR